MTRLMHWVRYPGSRQTGTGMHLSVAMCMLVATGCAQIPVAELGAYRSAFDQAQSASEQVLLDFDRTLTESKGLVKRAEDAKRQAFEPFPSEWKNIPHKPGEGADADVEARRQALEVVDRYNDSLARLAEGKSVTEVSGSVGSLVDSITELVTVAGAAAMPELVAAGPLLSQWAQELEKARLRKQFADALERGAPVVDKILDALIADVGSHYELRATLNNRKRLLAVGQITEQVGTVYMLLASRAAPGEDYDDVQAIQARVNGAVAPAAGELVEYPYQLESGPPGAPAFGAVDAAALKASIAELSRRVESYTAIVAQVQSLGEVLTRYQALLGETKAALANLRRAQADNSRLAAATTDLLKTAFELRRAFEEYRSATAKAP